MGPMISSIFKPAVTRVITPIAKLALRAGATPNAVTIMGACGVVASASYFYPRGDFFLGTLMICLFSLSDLFDGAMARLSDSGASTWGAFLDSTIDRIADSAILISVLIALDKRDDRLAPVVAIALVTGILIPYIRAKAESLGINCSGGIAERTERVVIALVAIGLDGLGVPYVMTIGFWLLATIGIITVGQRILIVRKQVSL